MEYKQIKTLKQYDTVAARMERLKDAEVGTPEAAELKLLTKLVVEYESNRLCRMKLSKAYLGKSR